MVVMIVIKVIPSSLKYWFCSVCVCLSIGKECVTNSPQQCNECVFKINTSLIMVHLWLLKADLVFILQMDFCRNFYDCAGCCTIWELYCAIGIGFIQFDHCRVLVPLTIPLSKRSYFLMQTNDQSVFLYVHDNLFFAFCQCPLFQLNVSKLKHLGY